MARALREPLARLRPSLVVVMGDTDSTVAGALVGRDLGVPLAHVEAGLRSFERDHPEERNRVRVDRLSARLHAPEASAVRHLRAEGFAASRVHLAGNVMADALRRARARIGRAPRPRGLPRSAYLLATLHRQSNVDDPSRLRRLLDALLEGAGDLPVVLPVHPRTAKSAGLGGRGRMRGLLALPPLPYLSFLALLSGARAVVTDSGGVQVEASLLGVPCVTARRRTEHELTLTHGTNRIAGSDPRRLPAAVRAALAEDPRPRAFPLAWDGRASERIVRDWRLRPPHV
jgi:UDP-N-acetylglucosamine 2-epimerase (non-hydrolysing)